MNVSPRRCCRIEKLLRFVEFVRAAVRRRRLLLYCAAARKSSTMRANTHARQRISKCTQVVVWLARATSPGPRSSDFVELALSRVTPRNGSAKHRGVAVLSYAGGRASERDDSVHVLSYQRIRHARTQMSMTRGLGKRGGG